MLSISMLAKRIDELAALTIDFYLTANGALLEQAAERFAHQTSALDEVMS